jgi:hypothetical protein
MQMKGSRRRLYFHKLFHLADLGLKYSGIHGDRIIREFLGAIHPEIAPAQTTQGVN